WEGRLEVRARVARGSCGFASAAPGPAGPPAPWLSHAAHRHSRKQPASQRHKARARSAPAVLRRAKCEAFRAKLRHVDLDDVRGTGDVDRGPCSDHDAVALVDEPGRTRAVD